MGTPQETRGYSVEEAQRPFRRLRGKLANYEIGVETHPEGLAEARWKVAQAYKRYAPNRHENAVLKDICEDKYSKDDRSLTIVMRKPDIPRTTDDNGQFEEFAGSIRMILGKNNQDSGLKAPIEALNLMMPAGEDWEIYLAKNLGVTRNEIAELGRLAFVDRSNEIQQALTAEERDKLRIAIEEERLRIANSLMEESKEIAGDEDVKYIFAIMPQQIAALFRRAGHEPTHIPGSQMTNSRDIKWLKENYPRYWNRRTRAGQPHLYFWKVEQTTKGLKL